MLIRKMSHGAVAGMLAPTPLFALEQPLNSAPKIRPGSMAPM